MEYFVGVDLGGTNLRAVVGTGGDATIEECVVGHARRRTPRGPDGETVTEAVLEAIRAACDEAGIAPAEVSAAGVGSIGPLDLATGTVVDPANLPAGVDRISLRDPVQQLLDAEAVFVLNDTTAGAVGERAAAPDTPENLVYLTLSTGIGAGACVDGRVLAGRDGNAGEVGHVTVDPTGVMTCPCGSPGHWEAYCSGENIPDYARYLRAVGIGGPGDTGPPVEAEFDPDVETSLPLDDPEFSTADVFEHAPTDEFAAAVVDRIGAWNAIGVTTLVHAYAPERVVVGGAVALNNPDAVLEPVRAALPARSFIQVPEVSLTRLGDDVVLLGALARARTSSER